MSARRLPSVPCPLARPDDGCRLPPGTRYCLCRGGAARDVVGHLEVRDGQLFWVVRAEDGRELGGYSYVVMFARGGSAEPIELAGDVELDVREEPGGRKPVYRVRNRQQREYVLDAEALIDAACEGRECVMCRGVDGAA